MSESVKVVVRVRPLSRKEQQDGHEAVTLADEGKASITCANPKGDEGDAAKSFTFDAVFAPTCTQKSIYDKCANSVVEAVLSGYNGTIFAYGQTGAGKTFTMEGVSDPPELRGIIPNAFQHIFDRVAVSQDNQEFLVRGSYLEIYNEEIRDLLAKDAKTRLDLKENADSGIYVKDLTSVVVKSAHEIDQVMQAGKKNRSVGATLMNQGSSRSHAIFTIIVECSMRDEIRGDHITVGKLNLVDLAGSERQSKTGATGDRLKEATKINLSLSALGNVISALVDGKSTHIPYRDSKLTRLLQDSLGGNTKTVMCANCGPAGYNYDETVSTLRYANRAKNIKNKPKINEDPKDAMLREFQDEIKRLKAQLNANNGAASPMNSQADGKGGFSKRREEKIVEKFVEVEKVITVQGAATEDEVAEMKMTYQQQQEEIEEKAQREMKQILDSQSKSIGEIDKIVPKKEALAAQAVKAEEQRKLLENKLKSMEKKIVQGGKLLKDAELQEAKLRVAQAELEERKAKEEELARKVAEREEENFELEEKFTSKQEEAEIKTKKLQKLWKRLQSVQSEAKDVQSEFQTEREQMLDTIRDLSTQLKLKELIVNTFVPPDEELKIQRHATWNDEDSSWTIAGLELITSQPSTNSSQRRNKSNGERTPSSSKSRPLTAGRSTPSSTYTSADDLNSGTPIPNPYQSYENEANYNDDRRSARPATSRPRTARRRVGA